MSTLKADTIVASDGSSPVTLTKQAGAKVLFGANLRSSETMGIANNDVSDMNLNISSIVDVGTGLLTGNITNAMSSKQYIWTEGTLAANNTACLDIGVATTSLLRIQQRDADSSTITDAISCTVVHGDLA
jgi:site-specific recombinase XerC